MDRMTDPSIYPSPDTFDPRRFLRLRQQPGHENNHQLVSTSPDHLGFGHGTHACPGRFLAANEAKVALSHLLLMYEFRLPDGVAERPKEVRQSAVMTTDPEAKVMFRRRDEDAPR